MPHNFYFSLKGNNSGVNLWMILLSDWLKMMKMILLGWYYKWDWLECFYYCFPYTYLNPIQDGHFGGCSWMQGEKDHLPKICHTSFNNKTWHHYTLPKEDPKFADFMGNQQILLYQEIEIQIVLLYIKIVLIFKVTILMMWAKMATLGLLVFWNIGCHNFCPWCHQQNFTTWIAW